MNLIRLDQDITLWLNSMHSMLSDQFWFFLSDKKVWIPLYILVALFLFIRLGWKRALIVLAAIGLTFAACDMTSTFIKHLAERLRPCYNTEMLNGGLRVLEGRGGKFGFFSAHAANAFGCYICAIIGFRLDKSCRYTGAMSIGLLWAFLVAASRIFVGKHYFGDVVVGIAVGTFFGLLISRIAIIGVIKHLEKRAAASTPAFN